MPETITLDEQTGVRWTHVDISQAADRDWLENGAGLGEEALELLRLPRRLSRRDYFDGGVVVTLCFVDLADPFARDAVRSLALVVRSESVITVGNGTGAIAKDVERAWRRGTVSVGTPLELLAALVVEFAKRLEPFVAGISEDADDIEDDLLAGEAVRPIETLDGIRRKISRLRRYVAAIQNVLGLITADPTVVTGREDSEALAAATDYIARHAETLANCQERTELLHDKIENELAREMAKATYNLTIVATVFLPLTFITGLLGMNVSGIPEAHDPWGFWVVFGVLVAIAAAAWWALQRKSRARVG